MLGLHLHWNYGFFKCTLNNSYTWLSASLVWEQYAYRGDFLSFFLRNILKTSSCIKAFFVSSMFFSHFLFFHFLCGRVLFVISFERRPYIALGDLKLVCSWRWPFTICSFLLCLQKAEFIGTYLSYATIFEPVLSP